MKKNIIFQFFVLLVILTISITAISLYNLRDVTIKSTIANAHSISEVVKSGITVHMTNNNIEDIDNFLSSISKTSNVKDIWIVRSEKLNEQFNKINYKMPKDPIDQKVLLTGKTDYKMQENLTSTSLRVTVPFKAITHKGINCMNCHNVQRGNYCCIINGFRY